MIREKKDVVVGSMTGYGFDQIKPWVNSLDRSGFSGDKVMLCYNVDYATVDELIKRNYVVHTFHKNEAEQTYFYKDRFSIVVERFFHIWSIYKDTPTKYRYMITPDVRDIVFQKNPSLWLEQHLKDKKLNVACESLHYENEDWGNLNLYHAFGPELHAHHKRNLIYNAGSLSGDFETMLDLFLNISLVCNGTSHFVENGGGPDQAALNILLHLKPYRDITRFTFSEEGWAAQLGTTGTHIAEKYGARLVEKSPILVDDMVCTSVGAPFYIVHQYDRIPEWKCAIENKYS